MNNKLFRESKEKSAINNVYQQLIYFLFKFCLIYSLYLFRIPNWKHAGKSISYHVLLNDCIYSSVLLKIKKSGENFIFYIFKSRLFYKWSLKNKILKLFEQNYSDKMTQKSKLII